MIVNICMKFHEEGLKLQSGHNNYISMGHNSKIVDPELGFLHVACHFNSLMLANTKDILTLF